MDIRRVRPSGWIWIDDGPEHAQASVATVAAACHVSEATVLRWVRRGRVPAGPADLIRHKILGLILHPGWQGWGFKGKRLFSPRQVGYYPDAIDQGYYYTRRTNEALWRELNEARAALAEATRSGRDRPRFSDHRQVRPRRSESRRPR